jgi:hypothetical protein
MRDFKARRGSVRLNRCCDEQKKFDRERKARIYTNRLCNSFLGPASNVHLRPLPEATRLT